MTKSRPSRWFCPPAAPSAACCGRINIITHLILYLNKYKYWLCSTSCIMEKLTSLRTSSTRSWPRTMLEQVLNPPSLIQLPCQSLANVIPRATRPWPPPKRPCPPPSVPSQDSRSSSSYQNDDDDIQEVIPVKSEPLSHTEQNSSMVAMAPPPDTAGADHGVVADGNADGNKGKRKTFWKATGFQNKILIIVCW